uniref:Uncharacterized protein n=1 Tax=Rousettus aegyptiacus TaxID=9407 RepID=A0A7J8IM54_ROUAE|nr:hypothetical protein HJG63_010531 [Rousettus aegyptiacus]
MYYVTPISPPLWASVSLSVTRKLNYKAKSSWLSDLAVGGLSMVIMMMVMMMVVISIYCSMQNTWQMPGVATTNPFLVFAHFFLNYNGDHSDSSPSRSLSQGKRRTVASGNHSGRSNTKRRLHTRETPPRLLLVVSGLLHVRRNFSSRPVGRSPEPWLPVENSQRKWDTWSRGRAGPGLGRHADGGRAPSSIPSFAARRQ